LFRHHKPRGGFDLAMTNSECKLVKFQPEHKDQIIKLQTNLWGPDLALNRAYFEWKYEQSPYQTAPIIYLWIQAGEVVSFAGFNNSHWQAGDPPQIVNCLAGCDAITHPEFRQQGLFSKMTMQAMQDLSDGPHDFIFTLSAGTITTPASHKLGWYDLGPNEIGIRFPDASPPKTGKVRTLLKGIPGVYSGYSYIREALKRGSRSENTTLAMESMGSHFRYLDEYFAKSVPKKAGNGSEIWMSVSPEIDRMVELIAENKSNPKIRQVRDKTFFKWRYRNPRADYRFLFCGQNPLKGYLVLRAAKGKQSTEVQIVDWETFDIGTLKSLIEAAIFLGRFSVLTIWTTTLSTEEKQLLRDLKFSIDLERLGDKPEALRPVVMIREMSQQAEKGSIFTPSFVGNIDNWDIRPIYSDGY
jgi:hypothetical protein